MRSDKIAPNPRRSSLLPKERGAPVAPAIGLNEPIVAQDGDPGIPMSAARFLAEHSREFGRVHVTLALPRVCAASLVLATAADRTTRQAVRPVSTAPAAPRRQPSSQSATPTGDRSLPRHSRPRAGF